MRQGKFWNNETEIFVEWSARQRINTSGSDGSVSNRGEWLRKFLKGGL